MVTLRNAGVRAQAVEASSDQDGFRGRDPVIDYLRAFLIVLVILMHTALAYTSFSTFDEIHWIKSSAPHLLLAAPAPPLDCWARFIDSCAVNGLFSTALAKIRPGYTSSTMPS